MIKLPLYLALFLPFTFSCFKGEDKSASKGIKKSEEAKVEEKSEQPAAEPSPFEGTTLFVTYVFNGKPSLFLGETYEAQTGKKSKDLVGKNFNFMMWDGSVKEAKITAIEKECKDHFHEGREVNVEVCAEFAVQESFKEEPAFAFTTDLEKFDFKWTYIPKWREVEEIDLTKVKENIKRNNGITYTAPIGYHTENVKALHEKYYILGDKPEERGIDSLLYAKTFLKYATQDRRWEYYETPYASVLLLKGELFHVGINKVSRDLGRVLTGEANLNGEHLFYTRSGLSENGIPIDHSGHLRIGKFGNIGHDIFYFNSNGIKQSLSYALDPCVSGMWACYTLHDDKNIKLPEPKRKD